MLVLDRQSDATDRSKCMPLAQLRRRDDGRVFELPVGKSTVGSSPRCNLRIQKPGVAPVHCLVVCNAEGVFVRRWAANSLINGRPFDESPLSDGDCLSVGGVELELVPSQRPTPTTERQDSWVSAANVPGDILLDTVRDSFDAIAGLDVEPMAPGQSLPAPEAVAEIVPEVESSAVAGTPPSDSDKLPELDAAEIVFRDLQAACANSRGRNRKLLAALRSKRQDYQELVERLGDIDAQLADLRKLRNEWDQTQCGHEGERREWESQRQELRLQVCQLEVRIAEQTQQLAELRNDLQVLRSDDVPAVGAAKGPQCAAVGQELAPTNLRPAADEQSAKAANLAALAGELTTSWDVGESRGGDQPASGDCPDGASSSAVVDWKLLLATDPQVDDVPLQAESPAGQAPFWSSQHTEPVTESSEKLGEAGLDEGPLANLSIWKLGANPADLAEKADVEVASEAPLHVTSAPSGESFVDCVTEPEQGSLDVPVAADAQASATARYSPAGAETPTGEFAQAEPAPPQPASFIERYAHLFAEEGGDDAASQQAVARQTAVPATNACLNSTFVASEALEKCHSTSGDEDESIEQYMAKLLERVQGTAARMPQKSEPLESIAEEAATVDATLSPDSAAPIEDQTLRNSVQPMSEADADRELATWHANERKPASVVSSSDLGALRALANQTARRAISQHQLTKHRRDATTKVIVSMLAGVTSLWLMMLSPNWRNVEFVAACVSLLVAAYWAGEAFREMLGSWKAAANHVPYDQSHDGDEHHHADLPIDVEDRF